MNVLSTIRDELVRAFYTTTGGRPMKRVSAAFVDVVSGEMVYHYQDAFGRHWFATGPWATFRVRITR